MADVTIAAALDRYRGTLGRFSGIVIRQLICSRKTSEEFVADRKTVVFRFGDTEVRECEFALIRSGETVRIEPTAFRVLLCLLRNPGRLVTKDEIIAAVWHDTVVSDNSLTRSIATLRRVLDDNSREPQYIATVQTLGYRFLMPVVRCEIDSGHEGELAPVRSVPSSRKMTGIVLAGAVALVAVACLWWARSQSARRFEPREIQVTHNADDNPITGVAVSPDGKYLAYSDLGGLHVKLVATGEIHDFAQPAELGEGRADWIVSWLPDSTRFLAYSWGLGVPRDIWEASVVSGSLRLLRKDASSSSVSPDGAQFAYTTDDERVMWVGEIEAGQPRKVADAGFKNWFSNIVWSPDGSRLLYIKHVAAADHAQNFMEIHDVKSGRVTPLLPDDDLRSVYWMHDGRIIYVKHEVDASGESCQYWVAQLNDALEEIATQRQLPTQKTGACFSSISATSDGKRLYFLKQNSQFGIYLADLSEGATRMSPPKHLTSTDDSEFPVAWTTDSRDIVFLSRRERKWGLYRQSLGRETAMPILPEIATTGLGAVFPRVSPDGAWLLYAPYPAAYVRGAMIDLFRVSITGGAPQQVMKAALYDTPRCSVAPAMRCAIATKDKAELTFTAFDPVRGGGSELGRFNVDDPERGIYVGSVSGGHEDCDPQARRFRDSYP